MNDERPGIVRLTEVECFEAALVGISRRLPLLKSGAHEKHGAEPERTWDYNIEGAGGEKAVAKYLDRYYSGSVGFFKRGADVSGFEVRTRRRDDYDLIVRDDDHPDRCFILVVGWMPVFRVVGWMLGREAQQECWNTTPNERPEAYFVPQESLNPMETLPSPGRRG